MKELCRNITSFILNVPKCLCKKMARTKSLGILYQCKFRSILEAKIIIHLHIYTYLNTIHNTNIVYYLLNYMVCTFSTSCQYLQFMITVIAIYYYILLYIY